jgi:hypothetical protein
MASGWPQFGKKFAFARAVGAGNALGVAQFGTPMTQDGRARGRERSDEQSPPTDGVRVGAYEVDDGVVFYDVDNPLAWVEAARAVPLSERA